MRLTAVLVIGAFLSLAFLEHGLSLNRDEEDATILKFKPVFGKHQDGGRFKNGKRCVDNCSGFPDGQYQSCNNCSYYVNCSTETLIGPYACPEGLVWDDFYKECRDRSRTCPSGTPCLHTCKDTPDGNYESCQGCKYFATCYHGELHDNRLCPQKHSLVWDDRKKWCDWGTPTCPDPTSGSTDIAAVDVSSKHQDGGRFKNGKRCVDNCSGFPDGQYQSCNNCSYYVNCSTETLIGPYACPEGLVWDDFYKECRDRSRTCPSGTPCLHTCKDTPDGNYESCQGCKYFATCYHGELHDNRLCPQKHSLVWDDRKKWCDWGTPTCPDPTSGSTDIAAVDVSIDETNIQADKRGSDSITLSRDTGKHQDGGRFKNGKRCVDNCSGFPDGRYQSCNNCSYYVNCSTETLIGPYACPEGLVWDDFYKECRDRSRTCPFGTPCLHTCKDTPDGNYESCQGCKYFATCYHGRLFDKRLCPQKHKLVWDDRKKWCDWGTPTCPDKTSGSAYFAAVVVSKQLTIGDPPARCIRSCQEFPDGLYQSCANCSAYVRCKDYAMSEPIVCKSNTPLWDDFYKECRAYSSTCPTGNPCIKSCAGVPDINYQSCHGCHVYATCYDGGLRDGRPCPPGLCWDDRMKICDWGSKTCPMCNHSGTHRSGKELPEPESSCLTSCEGMQNGDYQSCHGCHVYVTCSDEVILDNRACPFGLFWDDSIKGCTTISSTCPADEILFEGEK